MTLGLLVTSQFNHSVREYNATTGAFVKVAASGGALGDPLGAVTRTPRSSSSSTFRDTIG